MVSIINQSVQLSSCRSWPLAAEIDNGAITKSDLELQGMTITLEWYNGRRLNYTSSSHKWAIFACEIDVCCRCRQWPSNTISSEHGDNFHTGKKKTPTRKPNLKQQRRTTSSFSRARTSRDQQWCGNLIRPLAAEMSNDFIPELDF